MTTVTLAASDLLQEVLPHAMFNIGGWSVTNHDILLLVAAIAMVLVFFHVASRMRVRGKTAEHYVTKGRIAQMFEVMLQFFREELTRPELGDLTDKYIGYVWTTFFVILFCNLLGLFPIGVVAKWITGNHNLEFLNGSPTGNINITAALAIIAFFMMHYVGLRERGWRYFSHFAPLPIWPIMKDSSPALLPIAAMLVILEIVGSFVKAFALCVRLFANMVAGHLVIGALIGLIFLAGTVNAALGYGAAVPSMGGALFIALLEVFIAFLQAFIFTFLTVIFIGMGVHHGDDDHDESHGNPHPPLVLAEDELAI